MHFSHAYYFAPSYTSQIPIRAQPLPHNRFIPHAIQRLPPNRVIHNAQPAIEAPTILAGKEPLNLIRDLQTSELDQTHAQEALQHDHVPAQNGEDDVVPAVADEPPQLVAHFRVGGHGDGARVLVLHRDGGRKEEGQELGGQLGRLHAPERLQADLLAVDRARRAVLCLDDVIGRLPALRHGDAEDGATERGVDGGFVGARGVEPEAAGGLFDDAGRMSVERG